MDRWIDFNGSRCYYRVEGKGKALVLVHGFIEDGSMWNGIIKALAKNYKLIIPDLPGFGKSPLTVSEISMEWYAGYIKQVLAAEKVKKAVMLGHSMGGYVTLHFAERYGDLLTGFGLINSHCFEDTDSKKLNRQKGIDFILEHGTRFFINELYHSIFNEQFKRENKKIMAGLILNAQQYTTEAVAAANAAMMNRKDKSAALKNATVPVLFVNGADDESAPQAYTLKQASYPPVADFHLFEGCKHMIVFERRVDVVKIIRAFGGLCW